MLRTLFGDRSNYLLPSVLIILFSLLFAFNITVKSGQQFVYLADSFLHGRLDFLPEHVPHLLYLLETNNKIVLSDIATWQGKNYWPLGPMPAIILMPFVQIIGTYPLQGFLSFVLTIFNFWLIYRIASSLGHNNKSATWLAAAFVFATAYIGVAALPVSWYFAQVVGTTFVLLSLFEFLNKKTPNWWLIGLYLGLATTTRMTLGLGAVFFIYYILSKKIENKKRALLSLIIPIILCSSMIGWYNFARFDNFLESGYGLQTVHPLHQSARDEGLFSFKHLPGNLYHLLLRGPRSITSSNESSVLVFPYIMADEWGISIFITSPLLILLFINHKKNQYTRPAFITSLLMLIPILTYYGIGASQFGYRYALDFIPYLYIALIANLAPIISNNVKWLIKLSIASNLYLIIFFFLTNA